MGSPKLRPQAMVFSPGLADIAKIAPPGSSAPAPGQTNTLPPLPEPLPFEYPPVSNMPGPSGHPSLPANCVGTKFYGDPPTRKQSTTGRVLSSSEAAMKKRVVQAALANAQAKMPLAADNLQYWLSGASGVKVLSAAIFQKTESEVPTFLYNKARDRFEKGVTERLKNASHPQGTLRPATLNPGSKGPVRFLQYRDGVQASSTASDASRDIFAALGGYNVHSVMWAQATYIKSEGGVLGIGSSDVYEVEILRWCVQIYDVYDWNNSNPIVPLIAPFIITDAELATLQASVTLPLDGVSIIHVRADMNVVKIADRLLSELEVSGVGRAYLIRSEVFEAPAGARGKFTIKI
jgi:hypothetical protein